MFHKANSFHPPHIFKSVAYSQLLRVWNRNSKEETAKEDLEKLKTDLINSNYQKKSLEFLQEKMIEKSLTTADITEPVKEKSQTITAVMDYFQEINQLKSVFKELEPDIRKRTGEETSVLVACRRGKTIGNNVVKNGKLCYVDIKGQKSQRCGAKNCKSCLLFCNTGEIFKTNSIEIPVPDRYNCKTRNVIYIAQCKMCDEDNTCMGDKPTNRYINALMDIAQVSRQLMI